MSEVESLSGEVEALRTKPIVIRDSARRRSTRKFKIRGIWRLELACGHEAFSLITEPHHEGLTRFCYSCDRWAKIITSVESRFKVADKPSRIVIKDPEHE